jgi:broad specificity polyphosphatase/5'/3'-nucleotidase SurE
MHIKWNHAVGIVQQVLSKLIRERVPKDSPANVNAPSRTSGFAAVKEKSCPVVGVRPRQVPDRNAPIAPITAQLSK